MRGRISQDLRRLDRMKQKMETSSRFVISEKRVISFITLIIMSLETECTWSETSLTRNIVFNEGRRFFIHFRIWSIPRKSHREK